MKRVVQSSSISPGRAGVARSDDPAPVFRPRYQRSRSSTDWAETFAWASIAVPACWRIWYLVNEVDSSAMSASRIVDSAAITFWVIVATFAAANSIRDCAAPMVPIAWLTLSIAESIADSALWALSDESSERPVRPRLLVVRFTWLRVTRSSLAYEPDEDTMNSTAVPVTTMV